MTCPRCRTEPMPGDRYCMRCGAPQLDAPRTPWPGGLIPGDSTAPTRVDLREPSGVAAEVTAQLLRGTPSTPPAPSTDPGGGNRRPPAAIPGTPCRVCHSELRARARFCTDCGTPVLSRTAPARPAAPARPTAPVRSPAPSQPPGTGGPTRPDAGTQSASGAPSRTTWPWLVAATTAVALVLVGLGMALQRPGPEHPGSAPSAGGDPASPSPDIVAADPQAQLRLLAAAGAAALDGIPDGTWVPQVSSKCTPLTMVDHHDASGRAGWPDGVPEHFPAGLTDEQILDFHDGLASRLRVEPGDLILVTPEALRMTGHAANICGEEPLWISLVAGEQHPTQQGALDFCAAAGLPRGECAARRIGVDTRFVLPPLDPSADGGSSMAPGDGEPDQVVQVVPVVHLA